MILLNNYGDRIYVDDETIFAYDEVAYFGSVEQDNLDTENLSNFFFSLPQKQTEILICIYMGFSPKEIVKILGLGNIQSFYWINSRLKKSYRSKKDLYF